MSDKENQMIESSKDALDVLAGSTAVFSLAGILPPMAALFTIVYTGIRIWESETIKDLRGKKWCQIKVLSFQEVKRIEVTVKETAKKAQENGQAQAVTETKVDAIVESLARQEKIQEKTNDQITALVQALLAKQWNW